MTLKQQLEHQLLKRETDQYLKREYKDTEDFQRDFAAKLRQITMKAVIGGTESDTTGEGILADHANLQTIRESLKEKTYAAGDDRSPYYGIDNYLLDQAPDGAQATDTSLAILADALDINIVLCNPDREKGGVQSQPLNLATYRPEKQTIYLTGGYGHWDAFVDVELDEQGKVLSGSIAKAKGDGNCGYNAVALALAAAKTKPASPNKPIVSPEMHSTRLWASTKTESNTQNAQKAVEEVLKQKSDKMIHVPDSYSKLLVSKILETQKEILDKSKKPLDKSSEDKQESPEPHAERTLSKEEKQQIKDDEALAWKLAAEDFLKNEQSEEDQSSKRPGR